MKSFELVYSTQKTGYEKGRAYSNPRFFNGNPRAGVTKVIVVGNWPNVVAAYKRAGVPVEVINGPRMAGEDPKPMPSAKPGAEAPTTDAEIPEGWRDLPWLEKRLLAQNFSAAPVINSEQADAAIEAEVQRRLVVEFPSADSQKVTAIMDDGTEIPLGEAKALPSDEDLRAAIKELTGRAPHPATSREKLLAQYEAAKAPKPEPRIAAGSGSATAGSQ